MALPEPAVLDRHGQPEEPVLSQQLEVPARVLEVVVGDLGVCPHLLLAELDQQVAELTLTIGQHPIRVPFASETPEWLSVPHLLWHALLPRS